MKKGYTHIETECFNLHAKIVRFDRDGCEMQCRNPQGILDVHHPITRGDIVYRFDIRNGILVCRTCHERYGHWQTLVAEMRIKGILLEQAAWIERTRFEVHPGAKKNIILKDVRQKLRDTLKAIQSGKATRETYREFDE